jgi:hypothetical protein
MSDTPLIQFPFQEVLALKQKQQEQRQQQFQQQLQQRKQQQALSQSGLSPQMQSLLTAFPDQAGSIISKQMESAHQKSADQLAQAQLALDQKKLDLQDKWEQAKMLETAGYHQESAMLRKMTIDSMNQLRQENLELKKAMFNAGQTQKAETQNKGFLGNLKDSWGFGVSPQTVGKKSPVSSGLTPAEQAELQRLEDKYGGQ